MTQVSSNARFLRTLKILAILYVVSRLLALSGIEGGLSSSTNPIIYFDMPFVDAGLLGAFFLYLWSRPTRRHAAMTAGLGLAIAGLRFVLRAPGTRFSGPTALISLVSGGLGVASLLVVGIKAARSRGETRQKALATLLPALIVPAFASLSLFYLNLTIALHPLTFDRQLYVADGALGFQPSFFVGGFFEQTRWLRGLSHLVYMALPFWCTAVYLFELRGRRKPLVDAIETFLVVGIAGFTLYHLLPVAGPSYAFSTGFPFLPPDPNRMPPELMVTPVPRNCVPSLHSAWALVAYWHARRHGGTVRAIGLGWLFITLLSTLGFGFHYAIDLVIAVPFSVAVVAWCTPALESLALARKRALLAGTALTLGWMLLLRFGTSLFAAGAAFAWPLVVGTLGYSLHLHRRLASATREAEDAHPEGASDREGAPLVQAASAPVDASTKWVAAIFFVSGVAGLIYEVLFAKALGLTFGSHATATTTVLATYMGGMALGSWLGGRLSRSHQAALRLYALCEIGIGIFCAVSPFTFAAMRSVYVAWSRGIDPGAPVLTAMQAALGAAVLLPPTVLMGLTLPVLLKHFADRRQDLGSSLGLLYGANTLGAALGSLVTGYVLIPFFGVMRTTWLGVAANLLVALFALRIAERARAASPSDPSTIAIAETPSSASQAQRLLGKIAIIVLAVGGVVTLVLEITYVHLLAVVAGNSAYAFALMLFSFLLGLGGGAAVARAILARRPDLARAMMWAELCLAATILLGVYAWDGLPAYFAGFAGYPITRSFGARELVRALVCFLTMTPPSVCIGAAYPLAMACVAEANPTAPVRSMARAAAANTFGNIMGALLGGFLLLPRLGSLATLHALAAAALVLALLPTVCLAKARRLGVLVPAAALLALFALQPRSFDYTRLASGANVYFSEQGYGKVIDHAESLDGGLTTVAADEDRGGRRVLTLLTNGKFQGDDSLDREVRAQYGFAMFPLLHTALRGQALAIGFGTGVTTRAIQQAGFDQVDVVELSGDVARLANTYFGSVNGRVLDAPNVHTFITEGRSFLLTRATQYDLVSMEISSIWFAGASALYNREFYQLIKERLSERGVLQQWVQLHRLSVQDIVSVLATLRSEFPYVWLYFSSTQGVVVACEHDCHPNAETLAKLDGEPLLHDPIVALGKSAADLLKAQLMDPEGVDAFLQSVAERGMPVEELVSTDDNLLLEYSTPRGNVRDYASSLRTNLALLATFSPRARAHETRLGDADPSTANPLPRSE